MASAQVDQQTEAAPAQAENKQQQPGPEAMLEEEACEPAVQTRGSHIRQDSAPLIKPEGNNQPSEEGHSEQQRDVKQPAGDNHEPQAPQERSTDEGNSHEATAAAAGASDSPESAQLRAQRLALEASEAQDAAQQAAKVAAEKQQEALAAAKEAEVEMHAEHEAAKAAALHEVEEVAERACKQQKLSAESAQDTFRDLLQTTAEKSVSRLAEQKGTAPHKSSQSKSGEDVPDGDALKVVARQFAEEATETVQRMMESTVENTVADTSPPGDEQGDAQDNEQPAKPAQDDTVPGVPETPIQPGQVPTQGVAPLPIQSPASTNGIQSHNILPAAVHPHPLAHPVLDSVPNSTGGFLGKSREVDTYRTTPENQPTDQGPSPMQVG